MRIGIWCDYGFTLEPSEGIGVFVDNLARGLVRADPNCKILLFSHPGQEHKLASTITAGLDRIEVCSVKPCPQPQRGVARYMKKAAKKIGPYAQSANTLSKTLRAVAHSLRALAAALEHKRDKAIASHVNTCDIMLLPYVGIDRNFSKPSVVVVHDLVSYHYPSITKPSSLIDLKRMVDHTVSRASLVACMSEFIKSNDLIETLGLPEARVRVISPAVPDDIDVVPCSSQLWQSPGGLQEKQYVLYPAAFRPYKNHTLLLDALAQSKANPALSHLQLAFTGIRRTPRDLKERIQQLGIEDDVVVLGKVSREQLDHLYRNAFATVVPSLYEQGSFPLMEALAHKCPVAAAGTPNLREAFRTMGNTMLYFDPLSANSLNSVLERIVNERETIIGSQSEGFQSMRNYDWVDAATQWMQVFRSALGLPQGAGIADKTNSPQQMRAAG